MPTGLIRRRREESDCGAGISLISLSTDLPDGRGSRNPVQSPREKYFSSVFQKDVFSSAIPFLLRGALRDRHERWDGMRWTRQRRARRHRRAGDPCERSVERARRTAVKRTAKACGPGTRCWCQVGEDVSAQPGADMSSIRRRRWQDEFVAGESTPYVVKTIRVRECRVISGASAVNTRVHTLLPQRTRGCGCIGHPAFPTPLCFQRAKTSGKIPGASRRGGKGMSVTAEHDASGAPTLC